MTETRARPDFAPGMDAVLAEEARLDGLDMAVAERFWAEGAPEVHGIENLGYPGAAGQAQPLRLYRAGPGAAPVMVYIHGGGWVGGSIGMNERAARTLAAGSGWHVASLSYRLAPAHPFPAGLEDCLAALHWLRSDAAPAGLDASRLAIGGASAGANLALAAALSLPRDTVRALVLFYGVYAAGTDFESFRAYADGPGLTRARVREIYELYDPGGRHRDDPRRAPLRAELVGLPPVLNVAAEIDVLRSENEALVEKLRAAGVAVEAWTEPGVTHGFVNRGRLLPAATAVLDRAAAFLARQTGTGAA